MKVKPLIFIAIGIALLVVGIIMRDAKITWDENLTTQTEFPGTKVRNATIGAGVGAVGGGIFAAVVGGIGIVVAGTGVGLPAGAALIATAASIGAGVGVVTGAATGNSSAINTTITTITHIEPAYETWQWASVFTIAVILLILAVFEIKNPSHHKE